MIKIAQLNRDLQYLGYVYIYHYTLTSDGRISPLVSGGADVSYKGGVRGSSHPLVLIGRAGDTL